MGWAPIPETVYVLLRSRAIGVNRGVMLAHLRSEEFCIVDTLRTRADFLPTHEQIVGVGEEGVVGRWHGVSGSDSERELVKRVEVGAVLFEHEAAEVLFLWRAGAECISVIQWE